MAPKKSKQKELYPIVPKAAFYVADKGRILFADNDVIACVRFMKMQPSMGAKVYRLNDDLIMAYRNNSKRTVLNVAEVERESATKMN
jgi:hypothetical protein